MKRLIFVRHGKAEEPGAEVSDYERSLTAKGKNISRMMAVRLKETGVDPGLLVSSPAFRAIETALIFADVLGVGPSSIEINNNLYFQYGIKQLLLVLSEAPRDIDTITLFGHNPSFTDIPDALAMEGCDFLPKSGVFAISFPISVWEEIEPGNGGMEFFLKP